MKTLRVEALHDLITTHPEVGTKRRGERFACPAWLAVQFAEQGDVKLLEHPPTPGKAHAALSGGPLARSQSSSQAGQASTKPK